MKQRNGYTLIEVLTYIACLTVILTVAYPAYHRFVRGSNNLRRNADDIARTLSAGERWRNDVRAATGPIRVTADQFFIPQHGGEVVYMVSDGILWRQSADGQRIAALRGVKSSAMQLETRQRVTAWRWELELASGQKQVLMRPLFTFQAVTGAKP
ncbi:MAG: prepilin-type N-terminal cleavage/methylation domain-containing protein [Verrucomicrobiia bacterium]